MTPVAPLVAALLLPPVPPPPQPEPAFAISASPEEVVLILATNRTTVMKLADPRDYEGLPYSLTFIRVRGPDGELLLKNREGWWSPLLARSWVGELPAPWEIKPGEVLTFRFAPADLTRGLDGPTSGACRFQAQAVIRDYDQHPWIESGAYVVESNWVEVPCARLFPPR